MGICLQFKRRVFDSSRALDAYPAGWRLVILSETGDNVFMVKWCLLASEQADNPQPPNDLSCADGQLGTRPRSES